MLPMHYLPVQMTGGHVKINMVVFMFWCIVHLNKLLLRSMMHGDSRN